MSGRIVEQHRKTVVTCTHCPRLCRFVCPVAEAEQRETVTPTALMTTLHLMQTGNLDCDWQEAARLFDHCTLCGRCTALCVHDQRPWEVLVDARLELRKGLYPPDWDAERLRGCRATLAAMLRRLEGRQGKWVLLGRGIVSTHHGNALYDLAESVYRKGIMSLDPVLQVVLPALERGYGDAVAAVVPQLAEVLDRADQVFLFDTQTTHLVSRLIGRDKKALGKVRSGWQLIHDLVKRSAPDPVDVGEALFVPSCGLRERKHDRQAIFSILKILGVKVVNGDREGDDGEWIGCCGGGGYPEEDAHRIAAWSMARNQDNADLLIGDRFGCLSRYAGDRMNFTTVLDLVAQGYGL